MKSGARMDCLQGPQYIPLNLSRNTDASQGVWEAQEEVVGCGEARVEIGGLEK